MGSLLPDRYFRGVLLFVAATLLVVVYMSQGANGLGFLLQELGFHPYTIFIVKKTFRLVLNDVACFLIIWALFKEKKYLTVAWYLFLLEVALILPLYFVFKLTLEGDSELSSPLLSQIHRLIVNPILMFLLIAGFFYQKIKFRLLARKVTK